MTVIWISAGFFVISVISLLTAGYIKAVRDLKEKGINKRISIPSRKKQKVIPKAIVESNVQVFRPDNREQFMKHLFKTPEMFTFGYNDLKHLLVSGETGTGKTTFLINLFQEFEKHVKMKIDYHLIVPNFVRSKQEWPFEPVCTEIDDVIPTMEKYQNLINERARAEKLPDNSIMLIIDETDFCALIHGSTYTRLVKIIASTGREVGLYLTICGQSILTKTTGLDGSDKINFARICLNRSALATIDHPHFKEDENLKRELRTNIMRLDNDLERFGLFIPGKGTPFLSLIPKMSKVQLSGGFNNVMLPKEKTEMSDNDRFVHLVQQGGLSRNEACQEVFGRAYAGNLVSKLRPLVSSSSSSRSDNKKL